MVEPLFCKQVVVGSSPTLGPIFMPSPWDPYDPPPGQTKKYPVVPEAGTFEMVGAFVMLYAVVLLVSKTRRWSKSSRTTT